MASMPRTSARLNSCPEQQRERCCLQPRATTLNRAEISNGPIGSSAPQLLENQISLQSKQQGLAWIGLACRSPLLQNLGLIKRPLAGLGISPFQAAMGPGQNPLQAEWLSPCNISQQQNKTGNCDGSCNHAAGPQLAEMMTQLPDPAQPCTPTGLRLLCCCSPRCHCLWWSRRPPSLSSATSRKHLSAEPGSNQPAPPGTRQERGRTASATLRSSAACGSGSGASFPVPRQARQVRKR